MKRVRLVLALLFAALTVPVGLLVVRALESQELERTIRHRALAERVFDEMERSLSRYLAEEEGRPVEAYLFYSSTLNLEGEPELTRSPLSRRGEQPFIVGHFQIDPDGGFHTPLVPRDIRVAAEVGDWPATVAVMRRIERVRREVEPFWQAAVERRRNAQAGARRLAEGLFESKEQAVQLEEQDETFELFAKLNVGAAKRGKRKQVVIEQRRSRSADMAPLGRLSRATQAGKMEPSTGPQASFAEEEARPGSVRPRREAVRAPAGASPSELAIAMGDHRGRVGRLDDHVDDDFDRYSDDSSDRGSSSGLIASTTRALEGLTPGRGERTMSSTDGYGYGHAASAPKSAMPLAKDDDGSRTVRVVLDPMAGWRLSAGNLMLYRTVVVGEQGFRQGVLLDAPKLGAWLETEVLGQLGVAAEMRISFDSAGAGALRRPGDYISQHRFAEPFEGLRASLAMAPLEGLGSSRPIYLLAGLLLVVSVLGLVAVDRMTAVVVEFAERRGNFVAAVTHELKTPLTAIRMYGEMLRDGVVANEQKRDEYYRTITDESERLSRLIDNVLEFSRLEKGTREFDVRVGDLGEVIREIGETLRPHAERLGFALRIEVDVGLPPARFDRDAVVQMIFNLLDNAMKYANAASDREIVLRCERGEADRIVVSVRDHGPGIARKEISRIFEPFYRVEAELTRSTKGSGIGLALVKELGEAMGAVVGGRNVDDGGFEVRIAFEPVPAGSRGAG